MPCLIRKIDIAKWKQCESDAPGGPSADAVTGCMRTRGNTLSFWRIESESELDDAVVAIASNFQHLDTITVAIYDLGEVEGKLKWEQNDGITAYKSFASRHHDLVSLNYKYLGEIARLTYQCIDSGKTKRFTRSALISLLKIAKADGKIDPSIMSDSVLSKL